MDRAARLVAAAAMPADGPTEGPFGPRVFGAPMPLGFAGFVPNVFWPLPAGLVPNVGDVPKLGGRPGRLRAGAPGLPGPGRGVHGQARQGLQLERREVPEVAAGDRILELLA